MEQIEVLYIELTCGGSDEGDGVFEVLDAVAVSVEHLAVDDQPEGVGTCHLDKGVCRYSSIEWLIL